MTNRIWANLSAKDVKQTRKFYTELGFRLNKPHDNGNRLASFLVGEDDLVIHFSLKILLKKLQAVGLPTCIREVK